MEDSAPISFHAFLDQSDWHIGPEIKFLDDSVNEEVNRKTPLLRVLRHNKCTFQLVKLLLDCGAKVGTSAGFYSNALTFALRYKRDVTIISALLKSGAECDLERDLCYALRYGASKEVVKTLIDAGCVPNNCRWHTSSLHCLRRSRPGPPEGVLQLLIQAGVIWIPELGIPLCKLVRDCATACEVKFLINQGYSLAPCQEHGSPWLCFTRKTRYLTKDLVQLLVDEGYSTDVIDRDLKPPLHRALSHCQYEIEAIQLMIVKFNVNPSNTLRSFPLHWAIENPDCELKAVKMLVEYGFDVNSTDLLKQTPLHSVILCNGSDTHRIMKYLLQKGCEVDAMNIFGNTALHNAIAFKLSIRIVKELLVSGATINANMLKVLNDKSRYRFSNIPETLSYIFDVMKILLKYMLLRQTNIKVDTITSKFKVKIATINSFELLATKFKAELQIMESQQLNCSHSLRDFIAGTCGHPISFENASCKREHFYPMLRKLKRDAFPLYWDAIIDKLGRKLLKAQLKQRIVHVVSPQSETRVVMEDDSLCCVMKYLSSEDLLNMLIAYAG